MALSLSVIGLLLTQVTWTPSPGPSPTPAPSKAAPRKGAAPAKTAPVDFDAVLSGKAAAGRAVDFPAVLLPITAVQTTQAGKTRYFVLAVKKDSAYMKDMEAILQKLRGPATEKARTMATVTGEDDKYRPLAKEVDAILTEASGTEKLARTATVPSAEAIVVEVSGMEAPSLKGVYAWENVVDKNPIFTAPSYPPMPRIPGLEVSFAEVAVREALVNLSVGRPPDLDKRLPDLPDNPKLTTERELESYNAAVEMFNAELIRRRRYSAQRMAEDVLLLAMRYERIVSAEEQTLSATVTAKVAIAADTYEKVLGGAPGAFVKERKPVFTTRSFASTDLLVTSYPTGASVRVDGQDAGTTPHVVKGARVGASLAIALEHPGHVKREETKTVVAHPSGVERVEYALEVEGAGPPRPMSDYEAKRIFTADFKPPKPFLIHVSSPTEAPGFKGKKDKDGVKRCQEIRRLVDGGWFKDARTPDEAEVVLELTALPKKEAEGTHTLRTIIRGGAEELTSETTLFLGSDKAGATRILAHLSERLKGCCWPRALTAP